jgi:hypothetical protein
MAEVSGSIWGPPRPNPKRKQEDDKVCGDCFACEERQVDNKGEENEGPRSKTE